MSPKTSRILLYSSLILAGVLYKYGRSLWQPSYAMISGKKTVEDRHRELSPKVTPRLKQYFSEANCKFPPEQLTLIGIKANQELELWSSEEGKHTLITSYKFTGFSGKLGPKLKSGDRQIPEGVYRIEYLNPNSSYHLSAKISYPNDFDQKSAATDGRTNLGGDIFIHGKSATIGCIPVGDQAIEELFLLIHQTGMSKVSVIIAPNDLRTEKASHTDPTLTWLPEKYKRIEKAMQPFQ